MRWGKRGSVHGKAPPDLQRDVVGQVRHAAGDNHVDQVLERPRRESEILALDRALIPRVSLILLFGCPQSLHGTVEQLSCSSCSSASEKERKR